MQFPAFVGPSYTLSSVNADCQRAVNLFPEVDELGTGKDQEIARLVSTPGLRLICTSPGPSRGMFQSSKGRTFFVSGNGFYELSGSIATERGTVDSAGGQVGMDDNGIHLLIVTGVSGYAFKFSDNTFTQITDENFPAATAVQFLDQYLIVDDPATGNFQLSALADATDWDGLDIASPEGSPDKLLTLVVSQRELILFGTQTVEVWYNSGNDSFPLVRREGAFIEAGIVGRDAKAKLDFGVFFWGQDKNGGKIFYRINGYNAQRVSNHAVESAVAGYGDISGATCWAYQSKGHSFIVSNFPGADTTWVFDVATGLWHERTSGNSRHRAENHCYDGSRHIVGDYQNGNIYELTDSELTDNGEEISRIRRAPHFSKELARISHYAFQLDMETGVGATSGNGRDPMAILRYSDDGGHTWSQERWQSIGKRGNYKHRVIWRRLGIARDRIYEVKITDPVPVTMLAAFINPQN